MTRPFTLVLLIAAAANAAPVPKGLRKTPAHVGEWRAEFTNGVVEACAIGRDGTAAVAEPHRSSGGRAEAGAGGVVVLRFDDDRTERWTPAGDGYAVEHWYPSSAYPHEPSARGTAVRK